MGTLQPRLPNLSAVPITWHIAMLDVKDCFFSIPLHPDDCAKFAFTVPSLNNATPPKRYHWTILPQGMKNSPTLCQHFVAHAVRPLGTELSSGTVHYMDDLLLAHPSKTTLRALPSKPLYKS